MKFREWLYTRQDAPDNDPNNPAKARFLRLRLDIIGYVDELEEMRTPPGEAREKTTAAFRDDIESLPPGIPKTIDVSHGDDLQELIILKF